MQSAPVSFSRKVRPYRAIGVVGFFAFLLKGIAWLVLPAIVTCGAGS